MPPQQLAYLQAAKNSGVTVDAMTLMTMNMGGTDNVADAQTAITGGTQQVATVYGLSTGDATKKMGMLPAIGIDNAEVVIDLAGATTREYHSLPCSINAIAVCIARSLIVVFFCQLANSPSPTSLPSSLTGTSTVTLQADLARRSP
jgi:hypothetical protein